ncbi:hypothetical protein ACFQ5M_09175 [Agrilactobacillus yilanensis]|uniref:Uncharacterized protein n=1 Tax=Agrilactobacillus yilanensis TaxID=2485997 RepID=A0ABW4J7C0_9LACO|nr:hypothetical protein [Agrilactobacillus yilanensis]
MTELSADLKAEILTVLLAIDDPYYLNTFKDAADEDEWYRLNEKYCRQDLQRYFEPAKVDLARPEVWRFIRQQLKQFTTE